MDNKKLLWTLNALVCVVILLQVYSLAGAANAVTNTATGGAVNSTISVGSDEPDVVSDAKKRGYYTAQEYADFEGINLDTVYRRLDAGVITGAVKVNHRWRLPCH
jgi:hypothetical protein